MWGDRYDGKGRYEEEGINKKGRNKDGRINRKKIWKGIREGRKLWKYGWMRNEVE